MLRYLIAFLAAFIQTAVCAETGAVLPLDSFRSNSQLGLLTCSIQMTIAQDLAKSIELGLRPTEKDLANGDYEKCITTQLATLVPFYKKALGSISKKQRAQSALKAYYAAWISSIRGISPALHELKISYNQRQAQNTQRLEELWATIEVEAQ